VRVAITLMISEMIIIHTYFTHLWSHVLDIFPGILPLKCENLIRRITKIIHYSHLYHGNCKRSENIVQSLK